MITKEVIKRTAADESLISYTKDLFNSRLKDRLNLIQVEAPLYVSKSSGINDNLNGIENPVSFELDGETFEIVHSLAKWKRWYLGQLELEIGKGIVSDMRAIRVDESISQIHSHYVDQWDWEKVISKEQRNLDTLIHHGKVVYNVLKEVEHEIAAKQVSRPTLPNKLKVIHTEELLQLFPDLRPRERENLITAKYGAVLLIGIGGKLSNGEEHDLRAPDYDDWTTKDIDGFAGLNADLLVWDSNRGASLEISSMGIRVDEKALLKQLELTGTSERLRLPFHKALIDGQLPYTIGGGIGQSRVVMFVTKKGDIKEVQARTDVFIEN